MIHHISIAAHETRRVAEALSEILPGPVVPAPPEFPPNSWFVLKGDEPGTFIEVMPFGTEMTPGNGIPNFVATKPGSEYSVAHAFISVSTPVEKILEVGSREGWQVERCNRGPFELIELWVENRQMLEFATPEMTAQYLGFFNNPKIVRDEG